MPLTLFRSKEFRIALSVGFASMVGNYGNVFTTSLFLQQNLGLSPLHAGLVYVPSAVLAITGNLTSGPITYRFGPWVPVVAGQALMVLGLVALLTTVHLKSVLLVALCVISIGAGGSVAMPRSPAWSSTASTPGRLALPAPSSTPSARSAARSPSPSSAR